MCGHRDKDKSFDKRNYGFPFDRPWDFAFESFDKLEQPYQETEIKITHLGLIRDMNHREEKLSTLSTLKTDDYNRNMLSQEEYSQEASDEEEDEDKENKVAHQEKHEDKLKDNLLSEHLTKHRVLQEEDDSRQSSTLASELVTEQSILTTIDEDDSNIEVSTHTHLDPITISTEILSSEEPPEHSPSTRIAPEITDEIISHESSPTSFTLEISNITSGKLNDSNITTHQLFEEQKLENNHLSSSTPLTNEETETEFVTSNKHSTIIISNISENTSSTTSKSEDYQIELDVLKNINKVFALKPRDMTLRQKKKKRRL